VLEKSLKSVEDTVIRRTGASQVTLQGLSLRCCHYSCDRKKDRTRYMSL